jgi:O-antigen ligase
LALDALRAGLLLCTLVFIPSLPPLADNFMFPRELSLHAAAVTVALLCTWRTRGGWIAKEDLLGAAFLALGAISFVAAATNPWLAARALGLTSSGLAVFWCARALSRDGWGPALTRAAAVGATLLATTALLEAYCGLDLSMPNRAPGGVLGHRNSAAHLLVLTLPVLVMHAMQARRRRSVALLLAAVGMAAAVLVLSRSRGAWLAAMAVAVFAAVVLYTVCGPSRPLSVRRAGGVVLALVVGGSAAVLLPNRLDWRAGSSHTETLSRLADYSSGSGRGRVVQYARTLEMIRDHPLLGVGPGNWTIEYPRYASGADPSYQPRALVPTSRLPQGDWIGLAAERGLPALALLVLVGAVLAARSAQTLRTGGTSGEKGRALASLCVLAALVVLGAFDPILLQPLHTFYAALVLGALVPGRGTWKVSAARPALRTALSVALLLVFAAPVTVCVRQLWAATLLAGTTDVGTLARAARVHPGEYRLHALLAGHWVAERRCDLALPHIRAARALFPTAMAVRALNTRCPHPDVAPHQKTPRDAAAAVSGVPRQ